jgi:hypothetical protein
LFGQSEHFLPKPRRNWALPAIVIAATALVASTSEYLFLDHDRSVPVTPVSSASAAIAADAIPMQDLMALQQQMSEDLAILRQDVTAQTVVWGDPAGSLGNSICRNTHIFVANRPWSATVLS